MTGRIPLISVFALALVPAFGLYLYLSRTMNERRVSYRLTRGLFFALIPALLTPAVMLVINPTVPYPGRDQLVPYVYVFYSGAGLAIVLLPAFRTP